MSLNKIISGGQSGTDFIALSAAKECNLSTGGTAPKNYMTEHGSNFALKEFGLIDQGSYVSRSIKNITDSDGTLAFLVTKSVGISKTIGYCLYKKWINGVYSNNKGFRPVFVVSKNDLDIMKNYQKK